MIRKDFSAAASLGGGFPCMWERGGRTKNGNFAVIIADAETEKPKAIYVPRMPEPCGSHALIPVKPGYFIIEVGFNCATQIWRILNIVEYHITAELVQEYIDGNWSAIYVPIDGETNNKLNDPVSAAWNKSGEWDCTKPYWVREPSHYTTGGESD
jgi:hypothetical protein